MNLLLDICIALSIGTTLGCVAGVLMKIIKKKNYTKAQMEKGKKIWKVGSRFMTVATCLFLGLGFIWCAYFLILGAVEPSKADYANNMSEMITSVLTVVSIAFAFYEFVRRKK